ncbi:hypothetical protein [Glycomyces sp. NPDC048151]|uniref:hypothetical protein n=1 Tax=Glycomyces sp. NPDC048151 TaxID=3364002 RepID=UPI0037155B30
MNDSAHFEFEQMPDSDDYTAYPVRPDTAERHRIALPFTPLFSAFVAAVTLAGSVLFLLVALPGEETALVHRGVEVQSADWCETGEGTQVLCIEVADKVVTETGWGAAQLVFAAVLAAAAAFLVREITLRLKARMRARSPKAPKEKRYY